MSSKAQNAVKILAAARREVTRRLSTGWVMAPGMTEESLTERLQWELVDLRTKHLKSGGFDDRLEPLDSWLQHAPYEVLVNEMADLFSPPYLRVGA